MTAPKPEEGRMQGITPNLWFDTQAEEAANFYASIFDNSRIVSVMHYGEAGPRPAGMVLTVTFQLGGQEFTAINGGPDFKLTSFGRSSLPAEKRGPVVG
jgi:predicted 3-demethylubiquinone-9 3-methyltransferase (glyoxalase superfamily)